MKKTVLLVIIFLITACVPQSGIEVADAWTRSAAQGENGAIYFTLINHEDGEDALVGITADFAQTVEIHQTRTVNDVAEMHMLHSVSLASGERVEFAPGGLHVMLVNLQRDLQIGETIEIVLHFANSADMTVNLPVQAGPGHSELDE